jgi:hypothetical protein
VADELLDRDRQPEIGAQDRHQAGGRAPLVCHQAGEVQLGEVADLVAFLQRRRCRCRTGCPRSRRSGRVGRSRLSAGSALARAR